MPKHLGPTPDIVLGDRHGASCAPGVVAFLEERFRAAGYTVARNTPYAGGFITEHHGAPLAGRHAVQIEINRALYMNEDTLEPVAGWPVLSHNLLQIFGELLPTLNVSLRARLAAE